MRELATGNLNDFDRLEATVWELQRGYIDISLHDPAYYSNVCLVNLREADSLNGLGCQNRPLGASIYQGFCFGEAAPRCGADRRLATYGAQNGRPYFDSQTGSVELQVARIAAWRVVSLHG